FGRVYAEASTGYKISSTSACNQQLTTIHADEHRIRALLPVNSCSSVSPHSQRPEMASLAEIRLNCALNWSAGVGPPHTKMHLPQGNLENSAGKFVQSLDLNPFGF
ncbi:MAG: hypothetical protein WAN82_04920, partial [Candidatus Bathyarchaeia archaeon]